MPRIALGIEYRGSQFHGWQRQQQGVRTIQSALEKAVSQVANETVELVAAGRTDKGVHALEQVAHFDTQAQRNQRNWLRGINALLPTDISVRWVQEVSPDFHARFSAEKRVYRYFLYSHSVRSALLDSQVGWWYQPLQLEPMQQAANMLLGKHDFSAFRASECQAHSPVKHLQRLEVSCKGDLWKFEAQADGFLMHMVRNLVGVLMPIGAGERAPEWAQEVLLSGDRRRAGIAAPPDGLYMTHIQYDQRFQLPQQESSLFFW